MVPRMSVHNVYPEFEDLVVARWRKAVIHGVAGIRIDPYKTDARISFLLQSDNDKYDVTTKILTFDYETDVLELYSERESKLFANLNRNAIQRGLLVQYEQSRDAVDTSNAINDDTLAEILEYKNRPQFKKALGAITSSVTIKRLNGLLTPQHKLWMLEEIKTRLEQLG